MNFRKIMALVYRDLIVIKKSKWRLVEIFYFPVTTIIIWGFFASYSRTLVFEAGLFVLIVNVFWNFAYVGQSTVNIQLMDDAWNGSLKQMFLSGVSEIEYIVARILTSSIVSSVVLVFLLSIAYLFVGSELKPASSIAVISVLTLITSMAMGVLISSLIIALGRGYGFLAWTALQVFILLSAPFFPKEMFPIPLRYVTEVMPYTHIFEAARNLATDSPVFFGSAIIVAAGYSVLVWPLYIYFFRLARKNGKLVRLG